MFFISFNKTDIIFFFLITHSKCEHVWTRIPADRIYCQFRFRYRVSSLCYERDNVTSQKNICELWKYEFRFQRNIQTNGIITKCNYKLYPVYRVVAVRSNYEVREK